MREPPLPPYLDRGDGHNRCCQRRFWCIADVCGVLCVLITWLLIGYAGYVVMVILLSWPQSVMRGFHLVLYNTLTVLAFSSHARTMLTDPVSTNGDCRLGCSGVKGGGKVWLCVFAL